MLCGQITKTRKTRRQAGSIGVRCYVFFILTKSIRIQIAGFAVAGMLLYRVQLADRNSS